MTAIVESDAPITLVGAGSLTKQDIMEARMVAPQVVAVDGGAAHCVRFGLTPEAVIGDFDSASEASLAALPTVPRYRISEQESTDFDKALRSVATPLTVGIGFGGARVDHHLAAFNTLVCRPEARCILLGGEDVVFAAPPELTLEVEVGTRVSLFPLAEVSGRSVGLEWPIEGLVLSPIGRVGTSNRATGEVHLQMDRPGMLVILPRNCLDAVVRSLAASDASWPVL